MTLLIDTYDTLAGAHRAVAIARELAARGGRVAAVRRILDEAGLAEFLFDSAGVLIRLDMSEYMEKHTLARLQGAPRRSFRPAFLSCVDETVIVHGLSREQIGQVIRASAG